MIEPVVVILAGVTSVAALWVGTQWLRFRPGDLAAAVGKMLECLGLVLVFFTANAVLGLVAIIGGRTLTGVFVSTYIMSDVAILGISFLQGLLFFCWRETKAGRRDRSSRASRSARRAGQATIREGG
jgi:hypothetical protein